MEHDEFLALTVIFWVVVAIFPASFATAYYLTKASCLVQTSLMSVPSSFGLFSGCMIQVDGKWLPLENYRKID